MEPWPWWLGAIGLAGTALAYVVVVRRPLGVSGFVGTALSPQARRDEQELAQVGADELERAMLEATRRQFGDLPQDAAAADAPAPSMPGPLGWRRSIAFLVGTMLGGGLFALLAHAQLEPAPAGVYAKAFGAWSWAALVAGGVLVGAGTTIAGGCTSGHGLVGCGRLQPPSLIATACFFGTAIGVGLLIRALLLGGSVGGAS